MKVIVTNDDGIDSPLLPPLLESLARASWCADLSFVVPSEERSWVAQAASRFKAISASPLTIESISGFSCTGTPADCSYLAIDDLFEKTPDLVVSGINIGTNAGLPFYLSSGTIGAARAAALRGVPAIGFSLQLPAEIFNLWHKGDNSGFKLKEQGFKLAAENSVKILDSLVENSLLDEVDFYSANIPWSPKTPFIAKFTTMERCQLGKVFRKKEDGSYIHDFDGIHSLTELPHGDMSTVDSGIGSVTAFSYCSDSLHETKRIKVGDSIV